MSDLVKKVDAIILDSSAKFVSTLSQYKWDLIPDSQLHAARVALTKSDYIMKVAASDPGAVHDALTKSAILGLDLTEGKRQGWLIPRKNQDGKAIIQLQVGYKGVEAIHQKMGVLDRLSIRVVCKNDKFEWSGDDGEKPTHQAEWFASEKERGPITGAFSVAYFPGGGIHVVVASISQIHEKHRDRSDSWKSYQSKLAKGENPYPPPWVTDEEEMVKKTMAYIASKQWPANIRDQGTSSKILETLHEVDIADYSLRFTPEQRDAFYSFINTGDSLGLYLFSKRIDIEGFAALFNTFPKGEKTKQKAIVRDMEKTGSELLQCVRSALESNDQGLLLETMEGCQEVTHKLVKSVLDESQRSAFDALLKDAA